MEQLASEEKFEEAELVRRHLEKVQKARKEVKEKFPSVWTFDYVVLLPSDSTARTKVVFVRSGSIVGFEEYETATLAESLPGEVARRFAEAPAAAINPEWQYDEFCLVANYLAHPLKSVEMIRLGEGADLGEALRKRGK
jgi:excinuclease UvrABC nuclease subunit